MLIKYELIYFIGGNKFIIIYEENQKLLLLGRLANILEKNINFTLTQKIEE